MYMTGQFITTSSLANNSDRKENFSVEREGERERAREREREREREQERERERQFFVLCQQTTG
jgi:hypothetical protein